MTKSVTLYVPNLLAAINPVQATVLRDYLAKANQIASEVGEAINWDVFFTPPLHVSAGALLAAYTGTINSSAHYALVSLVDCYADQHTVYVARKTTALAEEAENSILHLLQTFLAQDNIQLQKIANGLWLFEMTHHQAVNFEDVNHLMGKSMASLLPTGTDALYWRKLLTECQMLLSQHPLNQAGYHTSIWFWGNGSQQKALKTDFQRIVSDEPVLCAMAFNANVINNPLPASWDSTLLENVDEILIADMRFQQQPNADIAVFSEQWLMPLLSALKAGSITSLRLLAGNQREYILKRRHLYYFWRNHKGIDLNP